MASEQALIFSILQSCTCKLVWNLFILVILMFNYHIVWLLFDSQPVLLSIADHLIHFPMIENKRASFTLNLTKILFFLLPINFYYSFTNLAILCCHFSISWSFYIFIFFIRIICNHSFFISANKLFINVYQCWFLLSNS